MKANVSKRLIFRVKVVKVPGDEFFWPFSFVRAKILNYSLLPSRIELLAVKKGEEEETGFAPLFCLKETKYSSNMT